MKHIVARMHEGQTFDYLHSIDPDTGRMLICTSKAGAMVFDDYTAAADAAGSAMDNDPHGSEYRATPADI